MHLKVHQTYATIQTARCIALLRRLHASPPSVAFVRVAASPQTQFHLATLSIGSFNLFFPWRNLIYTILVEDYGALTCGVVLSKPEVPTLEATAESRLSLSFALSLSSVALIRLSAPVFHTASSPSQ